MPQAGIVSALADLRLAPDEGRGDRDQQGDERQRHLPERQVGAVHALGEVVQQLTAEDVGEHEADDEQRPHHRASNLHDAGDPRATTLRTIHAVPPDAGDRSPPTGGVSTVPAATIAGGIL